MTKEYRVGDVVGMRRHGDCAIAAIRHIRRGRYAGMAEYTVASLQPGGFNGKAYAMKCKGEALFAKVSGEYHSGDKILEAIGKVADIKVAIQDRKAKRAEAGREALGAEEFIRGRGYVASNVARGDKVVIRYRGGTRRTEMVVKTNRATGKVAIKAPSAARGYRWIPATQIVDTISDERKLPCSVSEATFKGLSELGWHQVRVGSEFIERSYVLAFTRQDARRNGSDYDGASNVVHRDPELNLFWRETGSFD